MRSQNLNQGSQQIIHSIVFIKRAIVYHTAEDLISV